MAFDRHTKARSARDVGCSSAALLSPQCSRRRHPMVSLVGRLLVVSTMATNITLVISESSGAAVRAVTVTTIPIGSLGPLKAAPKPGRTGPEVVPVPNAPALASLSHAASGRTVDGIQCGSSEQTLFHIHTHLTIFVNGVPRRIPYGIGIPGAQAQNTSSTPFVVSGKCFYWLHVHAADGIIHIESPDKRTYTLGQFFDEWGQPLGPDQVGPATGPVTVLYNGNVFKGNPRSVPLGAHTQIQLEVGSPLIAPEKIRFRSGL